MEYAIENEGRVVYKSEKFAVHIQDGSDYYILHRMSDGGNALVPLDEMESMRPSDFDGRGGMVKTDAPVDTYLNDFFLDSLDRYFPTYVEHTPAFSFCKDSG